MATLMQLVRGTEKVLPVAMIRYMDGMNVVESIRVTTFLGTKMKIATATVRASGRHPRKPESGETPDQAYIVQLAFYGVDEKTPPSPTNNVGVRCSCKAYYFWMSWANMGNGCSFGTRFKPYVRKTPPTDPRYPPKNPGNIPGLCKHILLVASTLQNSGFYKRTGISNPPSRPSGQSATMTLNVNLPTGDQQNVRSSPKEYGGIALTEKFSGVNVGDLNLIEQALDDALKRNVAGVDLAEAAPGRGVMVNVMQGIRGIK